MNLFGKEQEIDERYGQCHKRQQSSDQSHYPVMINIAIHKVRNRHTNDQNGQADRHTNCEPDSGNACQALC